MPRDDDRDDDRPRRRSRERDDIDERPRRRKSRRSSKGPNLALWIGLPAGVLVVAGVVVLVIVLNNKSGTSPREPRPGGAPRIDLPPVGPVASRSNNAGKIEGTSWRNTATIIGGNPIPEGAMRFEFRNDGSLLWNMPTQVITGRYTLSDGNFVDFNLDVPVSGRTNHREIITISGDNLTLSDAAGSIPFVRVR